MLCLLPSPWAAGEKTEGGVEAKSEASPVLLQGGTDTECGGSPERISPCVD